MLPDECLRKEVQLTELGPIILRGVPGEQMFTGMMDVLKWGEVAGTR